jgi:hypothetical protein
MDSVNWLKTHAHGMSGDYQQGYMSIIDSLEAMAQHCAEKEKLLHSTHEYLMGDWEPDDIDRAKFARRVAEEDSGE